MEFTAWGMDGVEWMHRSCKKLICQKGIDQGWHFQPTGSFPMTFICILLEAGGHDVASIPIIIKKINEIRLSAYE
jgi:hypothetical protein